jgi:aryl-alcohol dehydrogenase-like predicted oxidoreductase
MRASIFWIQVMFMTLIGPRTMEHLEDFLPVLDMELDDEIREACDRLVPPGSAVANYFNTSGWMKMKIL